MTAMDAMTHAVEAYTCMAANPISDAYATAAVKKVSANLFNVLNNPTDAQGRLELAQASAMAVAFSIQWWVWCTPWTCSRCSRAFAAWPMYESVPALCTGIQQGSEWRQDCRAAAAIGETSMLNTSTLTCRQDHCYNFNHA